ncbi:hypothetical protein E2C01_020270 [Portunus trituberculatus]|uniref:Uncharacterized protein n=1 Tax=Portunus trituberculatus TaxID=210409 RepID=A0A5B7DZP1_PORTR|nr:hypothetical protein [Portunus trituberculatus]
MRHHSEAAELLGMWKSPYTILQRLSAVTYKLGNGTSRRPRIGHVVVEEGHFTWGQQGPPSSPDSEVGSDSEVEGEGEIDNVAECVVGVREDSENEVVSELFVSRPPRTRKRLQWWDYVCD